MGAVEQDPTPYTCDAKSATRHVKEARQTIKAGWSLRNWRSGPKRAQGRQVKAHLRCLSRAKDRAKIKRYLEPRAKRLRGYRLMRRLNPYPCGGGVFSAIPCHVMFCESGNDYRARNRTSTAGGRYQIIDSTWYAFGGSRYADSHPAAAAPPREQDRVAGRILADGISHWLCA